MLRIMPNNKPDKFQSPISHKGQALYGQDNTMSITINLLRKKRKGGKGGIFLKDGCNYSVAQAQ
jgi:hypothetical protein